MLAVYTRQIMLYQLGYYNDKIDGLWGRNSKVATKQFQNDHMSKSDVDGIYGPKTEAKLKEVYNNYMSGLMADSDWSKLANFEKSEFACSDKCGYNKVYKQQAYNMQALRKYLDVSIKITSGCRCTKKNASVGSKESSRHCNYMKGCKATDFYCSKTKTLAERKAVIDFWIKYMPNARYGYCNGYYNNQGIKGVKTSKTMGNATHLDTK